MLLFWLFLMLLLYLRESAIQYVSHAALYRVDVFVIVDLLLGLVLLPTHGQNLPDLLAFQSLRTNSSKHYQ